MGTAFSERAISSQMAQMLQRYYSEYRLVARRVLGHNSLKSQIQPTELAHEAALRLFRYDEMVMDGRTHFLSVSAKVMRQVLIDEVRKIKSQKRQLPQILTQWPFALSGAAHSEFDLEDFHDSLTRLEAIDPERARIVEQRFFVGLTIEEIADKEDLSISTVKRHWRIARAWLIDDMKQNTEDQGESP